MQDYCIVRECSAEARHYISSRKVRDVTFGACTYHASGVYVTVCDVIGGVVSISTSFGVASAAQHQSIGSQQGRHELAG